MSERDWENRSEEELTSSSDDTEAALSALIQLLRDEDLNTPALQEEMPAATTAPATTSLGQNGPTINIRSAKKTVADQSEQILYRKTDRENLSTDDKTTLMKVATAKVHKRYDVLNLGIDDEEKLDETYDLQVLVKKTRRAHYKYDLHDVFTVVFPNEADETTIDKTMDLYENYHAITPAQVAKSNRWYKEWAADSWVEDNLSYTYEFLQNNTQEDLWVKVSETYDEYPAAEQGGPLFFILLMKHLLSDSEAAAEALNNRVKGFKIQSLKGEDIFRAVSLLRGAVRRLKHINAMPQDIVKIMLDIMQTSSVDDFNQHFHQLAQERKRASTWNRTNKITVEEIFQLGESVYREMLENDTWSGISTKGTESAFLAKGGKLTCFNCGGPHVVGKCPKPKDQKKINANRQAFVQSRTPTKGNTGSNTNGGNDFKFRKPESGEKNKRVIDGKPMWYHWKSHRWIPDRRQSSDGSNTTATASTSSTSSTNTSPPSTIHTDATLKASNTSDDKDGDKPQKKQIIQASLANTSKSISQALTTFTNDLMENYND